MWIQDILCIIIIYNSHLTFEYRVKIIVNFFEFSFMGDYLKAVIETQLIGAFRVAVTMPLEHVLDRIKTYK